MSSARLLVARDLCTEQPAQRASRLNKDLLAGRTQSRRITRYISINTRKDRGEGEQRLARDASVRESQTAETVKSKEPLRGWSSGRDCLPAISCVLPSDQSSLYHRHDAQHLWNLPGGWARWHRRGPCHRWCSPDGGTKGLTKSSLGFSRVAAICAKAVACVVFLKRDETCMKRATHVSSPHTPDALGHAVILCSVQPVSQASETQGPLWGFLSTRIQVP